MTDDDDVVDDVDDNDDDDDDGKDEGDGNVSVEYVTDCDDG